MPEKYSCPQCGKELDEKYAISCTCPHCHKIFDKPAIQQSSSQEDQEKEDLGEGEADEKAEEEREELPPKTINRFELLALLSLLIILLVSYFTISRITTSKKAAQEKSRPAILPQQKEAGNISQAEILPAEKLKEEEEKRQEGIIQAEKLQEAEEKVARAEELQQETKKTLEEMRLAAQEGILQAKRLQEAEEKVARAEKLRQEAEKALEEMRFAAQKKTEDEKRFQYYDDKGEIAFRNGSYTDALGFYQEALTHKSGDPETQKKISLTFAKIQSVQKIKQIEPKQEKKQVADMVLIPAGEFRMGSLRDEGAADEHPQHKVILSAYYLDKHEVTVAQYRAFCQATGRKMPSAPSRGWIDTHPIVCVTWDDATAYANYYGKRLPTEAEWEKAARAGSKTSYCFGNSEADLKNYAWYSANSSNQTHPVGAKKPNAFGLYDMHGNVWEWCSDWYDQNYYANSPKNNPQGSTSGTLRVARGGGWGYSAVRCSSALRYKLSPLYWDGCLGFRCASQ